MKFRQPWKVGIVLVCIWGMFLVACGPTSAPITTILPSCKPKDNVYIPESGNSRLILSIYQSALVSNQTAYSENRTNAQNRALMLLRDDVQRWSSFNDIPISGSQTVRITLTYISPELVQEIILNQYLSNPSALSLETFQGMLTEEMGQIAQRDEFFFLITLTASEYNPNATSDNMLILDIPVKEMILVNAEDLKVSPNHDDHPIDQEIILSRGPLSGYVAYPMAVQVGESCVQVLESLWNTTITISLSRLIINGTQYNHQLTWFIKYHPLVELNFNSPQSPASPLQSAPAIATSPPTPVVNVSEPDAVYWENMARYVWAYVVDP